MNPTVRIIRLPYDAHRQNVLKPYRWFKLPVLVCVLIAATATASARTFQLDKISRGTQEFFGTVSYAVEKAYAGNDKLEVSVSLWTKGGTNFELIKFDAPEQSKIIFKQIGRTPSFDSTTGLRTTEYKYLAHIPEGTEPRIYVATLTLAIPGDKNHDCPLWFYVGVRNKGKLNVVSDSVSATEFYTGATNTYRLELENNFPDYPVNVRSVTIKSDPSGLIEGATIPIDKFTIEPQQRGAIDLKLNTVPMSFSNLLSGFSDSSRLIINLTYEDGYGRVLTDLSHPVKLKIRPRDHVLVIAMIIGVVIGAIIKLYLQQLQRTGVITKREMLAAVGITSLLGLLVSFAAVVGRIKIIAFDIMGSYDNPAVIFIISVAGAVGGAQLFSIIFNKSGSDRSATTSTTTTANSVS